MTLSSSDHHLVNAALHLIDLLAPEQSREPIQDSVNLQDCVQQRKGVASCADTSKNLETPMGQDIYSRATDHQGATKASDSLGYNLRQTTSEKNTSLGVQARCQSSAVKIQVDRQIPLVEKDKSAMEGTNSSEKLGPNCCQYNKDIGSDALLLQMGSSKPRRRPVPCCRMGVRLLQATGLEAREEIDPFAEIRVETVVEKSQAISKNSNPEWSDFHVFEVRNPNVSILKVKIMDEVTCWKNILLGEVHLSISGFAMDPVGSQTPKWHVLTRRGQTTGRILMQVYYNGDQDLRPLRVLCKTWNVGNEEPVGNLAQCFKDLENSGYDLIAVGAQECSYKIGHQTEDTHIGILCQDCTGDSQSSIQGNLDDQMGRRATGRLSASTSLKKAFDKLPQNQDTKSAFEDLIKDVLGENYCLVKSSSMRHIRLLLFASNAVFPTILDVKSACQATGVGGVGQNKGGIAISVNVWDTELCFVNSHLAAHQGKVHLRNAMFRNIVRGIRLDPYNMDILTGHHHVFWMGDLNYRLSLGQQGSSPTGDEFAAVVQMCYEQNVQEILKLDELEHEIRNKRVFQQFNEGPICFHPTFKMERIAGNIWDPARLPAWCDRVLWKSVIKCKNATNLGYYSVPEMSSSDHKPVVALFDVPRVIYSYDPSMEKVVVVDILRLYANGLFMLKKRTRKGLRAPNPQVIISGPRIRQHKTTVAMKTRDPIWPLPIRLKIKESELESLVNYRLLFRVVSVGQGATQTLGRGVLDFVTAQPQNNTKRMSFSFNKLIQYNGLPAGNLCGDVKASVRVKRRTRKSISEPILDKMKRDGSGLSQGPRRQSILA